MTTEHLPTGPDPESITRIIREMWPETDSRRSAWRHVLLARHREALAEFRDDRHDRRTRRGGSVEAVAPPGVFRLNIGVSRATFERLVGSMAEPAYAEFDRILPHPVYAKQLLDLDPQPERRDVS